MSDDKDKRIVLRPNETPEIIGTWTVAEMQQLLNAVNRWIGLLNVPETPVEQMIEKS